MLLLLTEPVPVSPAPCVSVELLCGVLRGDILLTRTWPGASSIPTAARTLRHPGIPPGLKDLTPPSSLWGCPVAMGLGKKGFGNEIHVSSFGVGEGSSEGSFRQIKAMSGGSWLTLC